MASSRVYQYRVVDVFTDRPLEGNPLAVFPHALGLDDVTMQKIARELNLSETVFVFPPLASGNAARVRIFTPSREMDFAGHPTIGASFVLLDDGIMPAESERFMGLASEDLLAAAAPQRLSAGNPTVFIAVRKKETVDRAWLDTGGLGENQRNQPGADMYFRIRGHA